MRHVPYVLSTTLPGAMLAPFSFRLYVRQRKKRILGLIFNSVSFFGMKYIFGKSRSIRKKNSYLSALVGLLTSQSQTDPTLDLGLRIKEIMLWYESLLFLIVFSTVVTRFFTYV